MQGMILPQHGVATDSPFATWPDTGQVADVGTPQFLTIADQVAEHLRQEILRGRWSPTLPGKHQLAAELGVNNKTVEAALRQLEGSGLLLPQGAGRKRLIAPGHGGPSRSLRIALLLNEHEVDQTSELHLELTHALAAAGHTVFAAPKSLSALGFDRKRVAALVEQTVADAWVIYAGSREILEWFASQSAPSFAVFGHRVGIRIAAVAPHKPPAIVEATRHLLTLGHRRIVLLARRSIRLPKPTVSAAAFLDTLHARGWKTGDFNMPDWEETNAGFQECLQSLFRTTPPTALIVDEAPYLVAAMQFLLSRGIRVPGDVSLISTDDDPAFARCEPRISCIAWDHRAVVRRVVNWASNVSRGHADVRQTLTPAEFIVGGTTAAAPRQS